MPSVKELIKKIPIVKLLLEKRSVSKRNNLFPGSQTYWEERYKTGGTSGSGSYGRLAEYKAAVLNQFVSRNSISSIIELGCGDGNQLGLAAYPSYTGFDISHEAVKRCNAMYQHDSTKQFFHLDYLKENAQTVKAECSLSIDVIFHLVEDRVFEEYMNLLFQASTKYVVIYSSNYSNSQTFHERERNFTSWIEEHQTEWTLTGIEKNKFPYDPKNADETSKSDFYFFQKVGV